MSTQTLNTITEEDTSYNAWNQFNEIRNSQTFDKPVYKVINIEKEEEFDEETLIDSAWSKFCEMKTQNDNKPEYKRTLKEKTEVSDNAWKEVKENTEDNNSTEEDTVIEGAWKEFIENKNNTAVKKSEYIKVTEEDIEEISSEIEYENSAWNNFKSIESEEKAKKNQTIVIDNKKKEGRVKIQLADCAWNQFVISDKNLFDKYQKSLERIEDDIIIDDDKSTNSLVIEGESVNIIDYVKKIDSEKPKEEIKEIVNEVKPIEEVKEEIKETEKEVKPIEEVKRDIKETLQEEVKPVEEIKEEIKETIKEVKPVEEVKEEIKETVQEVKPVEGVKGKKKSKKNKLLKLLKKTKKAIKKIFKKSKKNKN